MVHKMNKNNLFRIKSDKTLNDVIRTKFKEFCKRSSLHGLYYFYGSSSFWIHLAWCLILISTTALCAFLSHMIWQKYALNPTFTIVETTQWSTEKVAFPALSICDPQVIYTPRANNVTNILKLRGYNHSAINEFYNSFVDIRDSEYTPKEYIKKMHSTLEDLGYSYNILINELRKPCEVLLRQCLWRSKQYNCSSMFRDVFTIAGHCCQFDLQYFKLHAESSVKFTAGIEIFEALEVIVNTQKETYDGVISDGLVFMYVFDNENDLTLLDSSITLTSATYFDVTVDVWVIDSSADVRALTLEDRQCFLESDADTSSYQSCIMVYIMRTVAQQCKCLPFYYTAAQLRVEDQPSCSWQKTKCVYETIEKVQADMRNVIARLGCYQKCDYVQYETETELVTRDRIVREGEERTCRVTVHYDDATCIKYRREVLYSWDQMLANLGGIFGLCLGGSIISIIEIIWFLIELACTTATGLRKKQISPKNNVFTIKNGVHFYKRDTKIDLPFVN